MFMIYVNKIEHYKKFIEIYELTRQTFLLDTNTIVSIFFLWVTKTSRESYKWSGQSTVTLKLDTRVLTQLATNKIVLLFKIKPSKCHEKCFGFHLNINFWTLVFIGHWAISNDPVGMYRKVILIEWQMLLAPHNSKFVNFTHLPLYLQLCRGLKWKKRKVIPNVRCSASNICKCWFTNSYSMSGSIRVLIRSQRQLDLMVVPIAMLTKTPLIWGEIVIRRVASK